MLYAPARLDRRMAWFEHLWLPGIAAQTDPDFTVVVLVGDDLPEPWFGRLSALVRAVPQIRLVARPPGPHRAVCAEVLRAEIGTGMPTAQFRLDDDDAVAIDFVARVREDANLLSALRAEGPMVIDHAQGVVLGAAGSLRHAPLWTPGLAILLPAGHDKSVLDYPHHRLARRMPVLTRSDAVMFVRGAHEDNDSGSVPAGEPLAEDVLGELMQRRFAVDLAALRRALG